METQILRLKEELARVYMEKKNLTDPTVLEISQKMDKIIVKMQKQLKAV